MNNQQTTAIGDSATSESHGDLFTRNATGLVRGVSPRSAFIINVIPGHPAFALAASFFVVFAVFPGGSYLLGLLLCIPLALAYAYSFGLLNQIIPRSGGDYMLLSRVIHPIVGMISSFLYLLTSVFGAAFFAIGFVTLSVGPGLVGLGLLTNDPSLVEAGTTVQTSKAWEFGLGAAMIAVACLIHCAGWRWTVRIQNTLFWIVSGGLLVGFFIALFTSPGGFESSFNSFAQPFTGEAATYHSVVKEAGAAGLDVSPAFSLSKTLPVMTFFAAFAISNYYSSFVAGELRQASTMKTANTMAAAGVAAILVVFVCAVVFLHTFGQEFLIAATGNGLGEAIPTTPTWFFLVGIQVGSPVFYALLALSFAVFWPLICYVALLQPTRMFFAFSFDGLLPKGITKTTRNGAPWVAALLTFLLCAATLLWAVNSSDFLQILVYAFLAQLVAMGLVGVAAMIVPWRKPELYRGSTSNRVFLGIPVISIAGATAAFGAVLLWFMYFQNKVEFGLADTGRMFAIFGAAVVSAILFYFGARAVRRQEGVNLDLVYKEIPPE